MDPASTDSSLSRRTLLATAAAGTLTGLAGCFSGIRNFFRSDPNNEFSLSLGSVTPGEEPQTAELADTLESALRTAGIDVERTTLSREEFLSQVLVGHDFDLFVGRTPALRDPAVLYEMLHTRFADEPGWQNPYGFTNVAFDSHLERQRDRMGTARRHAVGQTLQSLTNKQPFSPLCRPLDVHVSNGDRFVGFDRRPLTERYAFVDLDPVDTAETLRGVGTDPSVTQTLNPLGLDLRYSFTPVEDLLYDSLATDTGEGLVPWLAAEWTWDDGVAAVSLREASWHDGATVTASDVAFTYEFLADTSMGENDVAAPAPVNRGLATAIDDVNVLDERRIQIRPTGGTAAAERAFTIPILPEHVWSNRTDRAEFLNAEIPGGTTDAVVTDNVPPVGSGLFEYDDRTAGSRLALTRNEGHFAMTTPDIPMPQVAVIELSVVSDTQEAIEAVKSGEADVTLTPLDPAEAGTYVPTDPLRIHERPSQSVYCVGYNGRSAPLSNPYFRQTIAGLLDKRWIVNTVFAGQASPVASPIGEPWLPSALEWTDADPTTPYLGENGDLDVDAVRSAFETLGHRYDDNGNLLVDS